MNKQYNIKFQIFNFIFLNLLILFYLLVISELVQGRYVIGRRQDHPFFSQNEVNHSPHNSGRDSYLQAYYDSNYNNFFGTGKQDTGTGSKV
jgi:hypothetical protein